MTYEWELRYFNRHCLKIQPKKYIFLDRKYFSKIIVVETFRDPVLKLILLKNKHNFYFAEICRKSFDFLSANNYYDNHRTVKRDHIFMSLLRPLSLTRSRNSCGWRVLFTSLAWTALETWSWLNIYIFSLQKHRISTKFWHHYLKKIKKKHFFEPTFTQIDLVTTVIWRFIQRRSKCKWRVFNYTQQCDGSNPL